jgi:NADH-quinone oxidoreductase subunit H
MDQLMGLAWKFMLPMTLLNLVDAGVWHVMSGSLWRWPVCVAILVAPCVLLAGSLKQNHRLQVRTYRYAD